MPFRIPEPCSKFLELCFENRVTSTVSTLVAGSAIAATAHNIYHSPAAKSLYAQFLLHRDTHAVPFLKREVLPVFYKHGQLTRVGAAISAVVAFKALSVLLNKIFPSKDSKQALNERIATLTTQLNAANRQLANSQPKPTETEIQQKNQEAEQARTRLAGLEEQIAALTTELNAAKAKAPAQEVEQAKKRVTELEEQLAALTTDLNAAKANAQTNAQPQENNAEANAIAVAKLTALEIAHAKCDQTLNLMTLSRDEQASHSAKFQTTITGLTASANGIKAERDIAVQDAKQAKENLAIAQTSIQKLETSITSLKEERSLLEQQVADNKKLLEENQAQIGAIDPKGAAQENKRLNTLVINLQKRVKELSEQVSTANATAEAAQKTLKAFTAAADRVNSERRSSFSATESPRNGETSPVVPAPSPRSSTTSTTPSTSDTPAVTSSLNKTTFPLPRHPSGGLKNLDPDTQRELREAEQPQSLNQATAHTHKEKVAIFENSTSTSNKTTSAELTPAATAEIKTKAPASTKVSPKKQGQGKERKKEQQTTSPEKN